MKKTIKELRKELLKFLRNGLSKEKALEKLKEEYNPSYKDIQQLKSELRKRSMRPSEEIAENDQELSKALKELNGQQNSSLDL